LPVTLVYARSIRFHVLIAGNTQNGLINNRGRDLLKDDFFKIPPGHIWEERSIILKKSYIWGLIMRIACLWENS